MGFTDTGVTININSATNQLIVFVFFEIGEKLFDCCYYFISF